MDFALYAEYLPSRGRGRNLVLLESFWAVGTIAAAVPPSTRVRLGALFSTGLRRSTVMLWIAWFGVAFGYYGLSVWLPTVFVEQGFSFLQTYAYAFLLALAQLPGTSRPPGS